MELKEHKQPFSPSRVPWQNRRVQRCLAIALFFLTLIVLGFYRQYKLPIVTDLHVDTLSGLHRYGSAPEAGKPPPPFQDNAQHKADPEPLFEMPEEEEFDGENLQRSALQIEEVQQTSGEASATSDKVSTVSSLQEIKMKIADFRDGAMEQVAIPLSQVEKKPIPPDLVALDPTKVALLLETRPLPHLPALLVHFISVLPHAWTFRFVGSPSSLALIQRSTSLQAHIKTGKLVLSNLPKEYPIDTQEAISVTLSDISFYRDFLAPAEWLLVFQSDSIICSASDHNIEDYVSKGYTWVGAPWSLGNKSGGNGGLSLRHIPPIIKVLEQEKRIANSDWEDRWLCDRLERSEAANMPSPEVERHFSVEGIWTDRPFGYHLRGSGKLLPGDIWRNATMRQTIFEYCPEIKIVMDMDLSREIDDMRVELADLKKQVITKSAKFLELTDEDDFEPVVKKATGNPSNETAETVGE